MRREPPGSAATDTPRLYKKTRYLSPWVPQRLVQSLHARPSSPLLCSFRLPSSSRPPLAALLCSERHSWGCPTDPRECLNPKPHFTDEGTEGPPPPEGENGFMLSSLLPFLDPLLSVLLGLTLLAAPHTRAAAAAGGARALSLLVNTPASRSAATALIKSAAAGLPAGAGAPSPGWSRREGSEARSV